MGHKKGQGGETQRFSYDYVKKYIELFDCELVSIEYKNCLTPLEIIFACGHKGDTTNFTEFKAKRLKLCEKCNKKQVGQFSKRTENEWINIIESSGFSFIEFPDGYKDRESYVTYQCQYGHLTTRKLAVFHSHKTCGECKSSSKFSRKEGKKFSLDEAKEKLYFYHKDNIFILEYFGMNKDANFECNVCGNKWWARASCVISKQKEGCPECGRRKISESTRIGVDEAEKRLFEKHDDKIIMQDYTGMGDDASFKCNICNRDWIARAYSVITDGNGCSDCGNKNKSGEKSVHWKGGKTSIYFYLRNTLSEWLKDSYATTNGKCYISGEKAEVVHHIYPFKDILNETLETLKINHRGEVSNYSESELKLISDKFLEIHNGYGLGIPLKRSIHRLFHQIFSHKNFKPNDWYEFVERIRNGEIAIPI
jgi:hypothetical protein